MTTREFVENKDRFLQQLSGLHGEKNRLQSRKGARFCVKIIEI